MALTVSGYTQVFNCDSDGMDAGYGALDTDLSAEGSGCLKVKVSSTTSSIGKYDYGGTGGTNLTGYHFAMYLFVAGTWDLQSNGGVCLYAEDTSGNYSLWYVGGSDKTYPGRNGFQLYTIDLGNTNPDENSGTFDVTNTRYLGFRCATTSKAVKENVFWDNLFIFNYTLPLLKRT